MKHRSVHAWTLLLLLSCQFAYSQEAVEKTYALLTIPKEGCIRQAWAVPDRADIDVQGIADRHLPAQYIYELEIVRNPPKILGFRRLTIEEIARHESITTLDLSGCQIADDDLRELKQLKNLQALVLDHTMVSGTGLKELTTCKSLRILSVHDVPRKDDVEEDNASAPVELAPASYFLMKSLPGLVLVTGSGDTIVTVKPEK